MSGAGGFSKARLRRMHDVMAGYIERAEVPGLVTMLCRHGEVQVDAIGTKAFGAKDPMRRDTIFRIASMTKPITAIAAMILVEECKLRLDEPVDRLLPELADRKVLKRIDGPVTDTVPANRSLTLRDLLTFRMGFGVIMGPQDVHPIQKAMAEAGIVIGPRSESPHPPDRWIKQFGTLPLMHQPGEKWMYHTGSDVLGVLIARAGGQPLESFMRERIFDPLGMKDTAFSVPPEKLDRLPACYQVNPETGSVALYEEGGEASQWAHPPVFPAGGAGLVSTVDDYLAFGRMMLNQGKHGRERIVSRLSIQAMTTDQLTPEQKAASFFFPGFWDSRGWGFGVCIVTARDHLASVPGRYGWDGGFGTTWSSDPAEDMVSILMIQRLAFPLLSGIYPDFWTAAYQAIDD